MGNTAQAIPYYVGAVGTVESLRARLELDYRGSFFGKELSPHVATVEALVELGRIGDAFEFSERARSRLFLDLLGHKVELSRAREGLVKDGSDLSRRSLAIKEKLARGMHPDGVEKEIRAVGDAYQDFVSNIRVRDEERASLMTVEPVRLAEIQSLLERDTTLVNYFVTERGAHVWVVDQQGIEHHSLEVSRETLASSVKRLRRAIEDVADPTDFARVSRLLHEELIRPIAAHIRGKKLIIVPHDVLHYVPFHALTSSEGRFLIEDYAVYYLTSASLLKFTRLKARKAIRQRVLALGDPDLGGSRARLEFARSEVEEIRKLYPQTTLLLGEKATEESGKQLSPAYDIVHFATHAELHEDDPLSSAVLLASAQKEDGRLTVKEIFALDLAADLVVLSGCETGLGKLSRGDEIAGLTRALIYAGTPSVVASLWKVGDSSTAVLMGSFYKNLRTMSKAEALRQAQLAFIRGEAGQRSVAMRGIGGVTQSGTTPSGESVSAHSISFAHPYFWAPFILVGDGS